MVVDMLLLYEKCMKIASLAGIEPTECYHRTGSGAAQPAVATTAATVCNNSCNCVCVKWDQTSCCIMLVVEARPLLSMHGPCSITRCRCRPILRLDNMVALVRRRELVNVTGAHAVVVEARPLPKVAGYTVPWFFAVAFGSEDKCCRHLFDHTEVCRQGNEQLDYALGAPLVHLMMKRIIPIIGGGGSS